MQYGSGVYDSDKNFVAAPVPRVRPEASGIADKHRGVAMYTCLNQPQISTFGRPSQKVNMDDGPMRHAGVKSPILTDPVFNGGRYSNRSARPVPRVRPEAAEVAEKSKGCMGMLFSNYGKPEPYSYDTRDENINPREGPLRKAGVRGPILVDPVYKEGDYSGRTPRPAPRVRPEAEEIANKSMGTVSKLFVTEERRYNEYNTKTKKEPKNHTAENVKRMRQIQRESKARERSRNTPVKALWKSSHYDGVESKVKEFREDPPQAPRSYPPRPHSAPPGSRRVDNTETHQQNQLKPKRSLTPRPGTPDKERAKINFVARNAKLAKSYELGRSRSQLAMYKSNEDYKQGLSDYNMNVKGKTPAYLQTRQKLWDKQERERIRNAPDPTVPDGHTVMADKERRETLTTLKQTQQELLERHRLLPVRSADSLGVRNRKTELERRILEVDEAIKVFERPRVFVKLGE